MKLLILDDNLDEDCFFIYADFKKNYFDLIIKLSSKEFTIGSNNYNFNNLLDLLRQLEVLNISFEHIYISGGVLSFSSEINIRTSFAGLYGLVENKLTYLDRLDLFKDKSSELSRALCALNISPEFNEAHGGNLASIDIKKNIGWFEFEKRITLDKMQENLMLSDEFIKVLDAVVVNKKPFNFIRINHCENRLLGYGYTFPLAESNITYDIQFGYELSEESTSYISNRIKDAIRYSDVLGVPTPKKDSVNKLHLLENTTVTHFLRYSILQDQQFTNVNMHYQLGKDIRFKEILNKADKVMAITCRDLSLLNRHISKGIEIIRVPSEHRFPNKDEVSKPHFPDRFYEIEAEIKEKVKNGTVVLIGAGILAKIYCDTVKRSGGIAIDVGSLMDAVENVTTRGTGFDNHKFWW